MVPQKPEFPNEIVDPRSTPLAPIQYRGTLPHIYKDGCTYFVTFCLADVAAARREERRRLLSAGDPSSLAMSSEPRPTSGDCVLKNADLAAIVENVLLHDQLGTYVLSAWCVMPNHVHTVVTPLDFNPLSRVLQTWKSVSAHRINRALDRRGPVWQRESFDHLVRDEASFERFVEYTENNPVTAGLADRAEDWAFGSARFRSLGSVG